MLNTYFIILTSQCYQHNTGKHFTEKQGLFLPPLAIPVYSPTAASSPSLFNTHCKTSTWNSCVFKM